MTIYDLMILPNKLKGIDTVALCRILGIDTAQFGKKVVEVIIKNGRSRPSVFDALLSDEKMAMLNEGMYKFAPGFYLQERPVRNYPVDAGGNILGYLSEVDSNFLKKHKGEGYQIGDYAGKTGMERTYEKVLMGQRGIEYWKRDKKNRLTERLENGEFDTAALAGNSMHLALDIELQALGEKLMENKLVIIIAHRFSTIQNVDKVFVVNDGKITDSGTPKELSTREGIYSELLRYQIDGNKKLLENFEIF